MNLKQILGKEIIKKLNKVKYLYEHEYIRYWMEEIAPLAIKREEEIEKQIEELEAGRRQIKKLRHLLFDYELNDLLEKLGYKTT